MRIQGVSTDSELIRLSLDRPPAFGDLYTRHARAVYRYAASRVGTEGAEDVLSNTFLAAFERRKRFDTTVVSALPWLLGFATVAIRQHRRQEHRHLSESVDEDALALVGVADVAPHAAALTEVMRAVTRLSPRDRDALLLHTSADLSYEDVAAALHIPVGTVRSRINRARAQLRTATGRGEAPEQERTSGRTATPSVGDRHV
ncbi:RNA polymerase sigma factor [Curtobacterium sp. CFBP9011]|uniref:RNA polymerase sigma factor n=1 Tax=Curtobacterium sp. CFBP9011 TaxID=3096530 RepID=UPI002A6B6B1C|nr:RNA polymerase sigma factor [Curtobacterium sp. CFBP9011]MDY1006316.1 RNA polymerase sigma factor [Curtobacterium sp. CFBP9011]